MGVLSEGEVDHRAFGKKHEGNQRPPRNRERSAVQSAAARSAIAPMKVQALVKDGRRTSTPGVAGLSTLSGAAATMSVSFTPCSSA